MRAGGGVATIYIKGEPTGSAEPRAPGPSRPAPPQPRPPQPCGHGAWAPSWGGDRAGANRQPRAIRRRGLGRREYARGAAAPPLASPARTWPQNGSPRPVSRRLPEEEIVPGKRDGRGQPPRSDSREDPSLPQPGLELFKGGAYPGRLFLSALSPVKRDQRTAGQVSGPKSLVAWGRGSPLLSGRAPNLETPSPNPC